MALHVALAMNGLLGLVYLCLPPLAIMAVGLQLPKFAAFSSATGVVWLLLCTLLARKYWHRLAALRPAGWLALAPLPLVWLPVLSAESVRIALMYMALLPASPDCHGTSSFIRSMHEWGEFSPAHAWMIVDGERRIWSYRELRFVPDARPPSWGGRCREARGG